MPMNVLVTGGAGYIGSHAVLRLLTDGHHVTVVDDLSRGNTAAIHRLQSFGRLRFIKADIADRDTLARALKDDDIEAVLHFAAQCYVGESVRKPLQYYRINVGGSLSLIEAIAQSSVSRVVFSSTCATYGEPDESHIPISERCPQQPVNPYGRSKLCVEHMLRDFAATCIDSSRGFAWAALRYFNVAGNDPQCRIGECHDPETHLIPNCIDAALGARESMTLFGTDYPTPDGTCIRDYVHVDDLIDAHIRVLDALQPGEERAYNVGIGRGYSVRDILDACERVVGQPVPFNEGPRRGGDPPVLFADANRVMQELNWSPKYSDIDAIIETAVHWRRDYLAAFRSEASTLTSMSCTPQ